MGTVLRSNFQRKWYHRTVPTETAAVSAISPVIDANGMVHIEATLAPHPHLMPGMTAFVTKGKK